MRRTISILPAEGAGSDGVYVSSPGAPVYNQPTLVTGDADASVLFTNASGSFAQVPLVGTGQFADTNQFTIECLVNAVTTAGAGNTLLAGPYIPAITDHTFYLEFVGPVRLVVQFLDGTAGILNGATTISLATTYHLCGVWDGNTLSVYVNGVVDGSTTVYAGKRLRTGPATDNLYIAGSTHFGNNAQGYVDEAAFFEHALTADRITAHADAALNRGYPQQVEGDRVTAVVTNTLWGTTKIDAGSFQIIPWMMTGQAKLDDVTHAVHAAQPWAQFYFDGVGDPVYLGWDYLSVGSRSTPVAVFGDAAGEVPYTDLTLTYDDEIYNDVTISGDSGLPQNATDAASQSSYRKRSIADTGLALVNDTAAAAVAVTIRDQFAQPMFRCDSITLNGANLLSRTQILTRQIGDLIRVRRRGAGGTPIDVVTRILGKSKSFDPDGNLVCTWSLARGFNAADGYWHEGVTGFSELGQTSVLA